MRACSRDCGCVTECTAVQIITVGCGLPFFSEYISVDLWTLAVYPKNDAYVPPFLASLYAFFLPSGDRVRILALPLLASGRLSVDELLW